MRRNERESVKSLGTRTRRTFGKHAKEKKNENSCLPTAAVELDLCINIYIG
jgi:hypothetical protein